MGVEYFCGVRTYMKYIYIYTYEIYIYTYIYMKITIQFGYAVYAN